jgi:HK97 family phage major capsid protein
MKLTRKEFEQQLALAKSLPADSRSAMIANLKAASVVEVDDKGVETPVTIEIVEAVEQKSAAEAVEVKAGLDESQVKSLVDQAVKAASVAVGAKAITQQDQKFTIPAEVKRVGSLKSFAGTVGTYDAQERAYRFGMWAMACMGHGNAKQFCSDQGIGIKAAHAEGTNTLGGYLVPEEFGRDLIDLREKYGVARRVLKVVPMSSDTRTDPRRLSGLTASFVAENGAASESNKTWDQVRLTAKDLVVLSRMSNQLSEDAVINVGDDLAGEISYAFSLKEDQCAFIGDGTSTYGGIVGVSTKIGTVNGVDDGGGLVLASGNLFSEFTLGDFNRTVGRIPQYADTANAVWVCHRTFYYSTMERVSVASGGVTTFEVAQGNRRPRPMFLGYPVEFSQVMPSADVNSQIACLFGDHSLAASFGDRRQDSITFSTDATVGGESVFERNQIAIRGTERFDINVHDVGSSTAAGPVVGLISASG